MGVGVAAGLPRSAGRARRDLAAPPGGPEPAPPSGRDRGGSGAPGREQAPRVPLPAPPGLEGGSVSRLEGRRRAPGPAILGFSKSLLRCGGARGRVEVAGVAGAKVGERRPLQRRLSEKKVWVPGPEPPRFSYPPSLQAWGGWWKGATETRVDVEKVWGVCKTTGPQN